VIKIDQNWLAGCREEAEAAYPFTDDEGDDSDEQAATSDIAPGENDVSTQALLASFGKRYRTHERVRPADGCTAEPLALGRSPFDI